MSNIILAKNENAMWVVCEMIGEKHELIDQMKVEDDGSHNIVVTVGGVDIDAKGFFDYIVELINDNVEYKAKKLLQREYEKVFDELHEIEETLERHKKLFIELED